MIRNTGREDIVDCGELEDDLDLSGTDGTELSDLDLSSMTCESSDLGVFQTLGILFGSMSAMACFIMSDIAAALHATFKVSWSSNHAGLKIAGILVLIKNLLAILCAAYLARLGTLTTAGDALLGCVGVVFIHEMDEKTRLAYAFVRKFRQFLLLLVLVVFFQLVTMVIMLVLETI